MKRFIGRFPGAAVGLAGTIAVSILAGCADRPSPPATVARDGHEHEHEHDDDDHHPHERPKSLAEAVAQVKAVTSSLTEAFAADAQDRADELVHEAGHLLEHVEELLAKLPEEAAAAAREGWDELSKCLEEVDEKLHGSDEEKAGAKNAFESVKGRLEAVLESLEKNHPSGGRGA